MSEEQPQVQPIAPVQPLAEQPMTLTTFGAAKELFMLAETLAESPILPDGFRGKPGSVMIALDMASRLNMPPLLVMQQIYIVSGKPSFSGQFAMSLLAKLPRYKRVVYDYLNGKDYKEGVRVIGYRVDDPEDKCPDIGTAITPEMVEGEKWDTKPGSKWKTMPEQMYRYRAASFFVRAYCPDALMGMQTKEELEETLSPLTARDTAKRPSYLAGAKQDQARVPGAGVNMPMGFPPSQQQAAPVAAKPAAPKRKTSLFDDSDVVDVGNSQPYRD